MVQKVKGKGSDVSTNSTLSSMGTFPDKGKDTEVSTTKEETVKAKPEILDKVEQQRVFTYSLKGKDTKLSIRQPTTEELNWADWEYARVFNSAISEGIRPRSALIDMLAENGIKVEEMQEEAIEISKQVTDMEKELEKARADKDKAEIKRIKENLKELREALLRKNTVVRDYLRQSAEGKADEARDSFMMINLVEFAEGPNTGKPFYTVIAKEPKKMAKERYKRFQDEVDFMFKMRLSVEYMTFINGLPADFLDNLPENQKESWEETVVKNPDVT